MLARGSLTDELNVSTGERFRAVAAGLFVVSILAAVAGWLGWIAVLLLLALLAVLNLDLIRFFTRKHGLLFALGAFAYHQLYYLYSMAAFAYAWLEHRFGTAEKAAS